MECLVSQENETDVDKTIKMLHEMRKKDRRIISFLSLSILLILVGGSVIYFGFVHEISGIKTVQQDQYTEHQVTNQFLLSTIDWSTIRTKTILYMRDQIVLEWMRTNTPVKIDEAYQLSEIIMKECDNFPYIEPFFVLAMQKSESGFIKDIVSPTGAVGYNQLMPSTGRLLCGYFGYTYSDSLLRDAKVSTHLAVKLLDVLFSQYNNWELTLADYNGGPYQAYYYRKEKDKLSPETRAYVPNVIKKKKEYDDKFKVYRVESVLSSDTSKNKIR